MPDAALVISGSVSIIVQLNSTVSEATGGVLLYHTYHIAACLHITED